MVSNYTVGEKNYLLDIIKGILYILFPFFLED